MSKMTMLGKVAVLTGASAGIGKATALALAKRGARVALAARGEAALQQAARQVQELGQEALVVVTDVTRQDQVNRLVQETLNRWGQIDILIANAGQYIRSPIARLDVPTLERSMAVNFYGAVYSTLAVLPHMLERKSGHIVLVSSLNARKPLPPDAPYVAAKFALSGFGDVLRQELYQTGVSLTVVSPGRVDTDMLANLSFPWISAKIPAEAVANAILRGIERRQAEVFIPFHARLLYILNLFSPALADRAVRFFHLQGWENENATE